MNPQKIISPLKAFPVVMCLFLSLSVQAEEVIVTIKNIENNKGNIRINIFTSEKNFSDRRPYKLMTYPKSTVKDGTMTLRLTLPPGEYGISLLDDENKNDEMDYNMIHMPKEGFGFSDYYHTGLTMPMYNSFRFTLANNSSKNVTIKMRYM